MNDTNYAASGWETPLRLLFALICIIAAALTAGALLWEVVVGFSTPTRTPCYPGQAYVGSTCDEGN